MTRSPQFKVVGLFLVLSIMVGMFALIASLSWQYAKAFTNLPCSGERSNLAESGFRPTEFHFITSSGETIRGWFTRGSQFPDIAIIVLPGAAQNTQFALQDSRLAAEAGFSTLMYEHRACASESNFHSGGYLESADLKHAAEILKAEYQINHIGVLGFSTGGSTALLAAAEDDNIAAVVAIGGFSSLENDVLDPGQRHGLIGSFTRRLVLFFIGRQLKVQPSEISPVSRIGSISPRPVLLIYGDLEAEHGETLFDAGADPKDLWIVPGSGHGGYRDAGPNEYESRIIAFFFNAFGLNQ